MDKRVIFAVAGSGKTSHIINKLTLDNRVLILTYTANNIQTLRKRIIQKFGYFPDNIKLQSYFVFLHSFCYKPFLSYCTNSKGINWKQPPEYTLRLKRTDTKFYLDKNSRLYHNRIAKLCEINNILADINTRIEKYYDCLYIDEIQDFAGHDFNLLRSIAEANCEILFVGDFYQHTFDTSNDGNVNKGLFNNYDSYQKLFRDMGLTVDTTTLQKSYRCSKIICDFIQNKIGISISAVSNRNTNIVIIDNHDDTTRIIHDNSIIKLFYRENYKYNCHSQNWGQSKGAEFENVCIVLNKTTKTKFDEHNLSNLSPQTKNKLYVACSRTKNNLYFVSDEHVNRFE
ncbi:MAG: AAA family ATPase [Prevotellaceae bacterium]|jgi:superfamily I DNA/RNA helicase|nr:AAA family ATPase [Prevotellaceae bacterium]